MGLVVSPFSVVPVRKEPDHRAELTTQWLFGETAEVLEARSEWSRLRFHLDAYEGWVHNKQMVPVSHPLPEEAPRSIEVSLTYDLGGTKLILPMGAVAQAPMPEKGVIHLHGEPKMEGQTTRDLSGGTALKAMLMTRPFLGAPYLWGGRTPWGVDCSGFTQMVYLLGGLHLPRDAWQQAEKGEPVTRLADVRPGDLAFFANDEGRIVHVGFILPGPNAQHIVHASGMVRLDRLEEEGILHLQEKVITHKLAGIKRYT